MTQLLPGQLLYIFGASILDAALLSWLALLWYRRSVNRLMREAPTGHGRRICRTAGLLGSFPGCGASNRSR